MGAPLFCEFVRGSVRYMELFPAPLDFLPLTVYHYIELQRLKS